MVCFSSIGPASRSMLNSVVTKILAFPRPGTGLPHMRYKGKYGRFPRSVFILGADCSIQILRCREDLSFFDVCVAFTVRHPGHLINYRLSKWMVALA